MASDLANLRARVEANYQRRRDEAAPLVRNLREQLPRVVEELQRNWGATRVLLFGSFARGLPSDHSDVDLAVEGVAPRDLFRVAAVVSDLLARDVDVVLLEDLSADDRLRLLEVAEPL